MGYWDTDPAMRPLRRHRLESGCSLAECAEACGLSVRAYQRLESGTMAGRDTDRDIMGLLGELAAFFSARLGRRVSAQWHLSGDGARPEGQSGLAGPRAVHAVAAVCTSATTPRAS